jgi:hypothetical protein
MEHASVVKDLPLNHTNVHLPPKFIMTIISAIVAIDALVAAQMIFKKDPQ